MNPEKPVTIYREISVAKPTMTIFYLRRAHPINRVRFIIIQISKIYQPAEQKPIKSFLV